MTLRFALLNLFFLGVAQGLFFQVTYASPSVQPFLNGAFGVAAFCYLLCAYLFRRLKVPLIIQLIYLSLAGAVFYFVWSIGIVYTTHLAGKLLYGKPGLFYGTSGVQFLEFDSNSNAFCLLAFIPTFALNLLANAILRKWLFPKRFTS